MDQLKAGDTSVLIIRMPKMSGVEALRGLAADTTTSAIPVVMLSTCCALTR